MTNPAGRFFWRYRSELILWTGALTLTLFLTALVVLSMGTILIVMIFLLFYCATLAYKREAAIPFMLYYLFLLGDLRRFRDLVYPHPGQDFLLLVSPIAAALLGVPLFSKLRVHDRMSKAMLWLTILMVLQIFNPLQGGLTVGFGGAMFYLTPVLWFWIGREYGTPERVRMVLYRVVLPLAAAAAIFGLCQNFIGFPRYQELWFQANREQFAILNLGGGIRSFGFSIAASEYETLLEIGACAAVAAWFANRSAWIVSFPFLLTAMVFSAGRGPIVKLIFALTFAWVARRPQNLNGTAVVRIGVLLAVGLVGLSLLGSRLALSTGDIGHAKTASSAALAHQAEGFSDPLNERKSTAGVHSQMLLGGLLEGVRMPIGRGLGSTTVFAYKFGGAGKDTEVDFGDMFISLGLPGGLLYLYVMYLAFRYAIDYVRGQRLSTALPVLAILAGGVGTWLEVAQYSSAVLYMFLMGCLVYPKAKQPEKVGEVHQRKIPITGRSNWVRLPS